jgi:UDP-N-acetyl-D-mannosaminuronate dehydrogenase
VAEDLADMVWSYLDDEEVALRPVAAADLVILVQNHRDYDVTRLAQLSKRFFDTRGVTRGDVAHRL